jgi:hypothetical protein
LGQHDLHKKAELKPTSANFEFMMSLSNGFITYSFAPARIASAISTGSFSVVQNMTTGLPPPRSRRSARRKSKPFITGMFQSSKIASGMLLRQRSSASCPSPASSTAKLMSSRMRRATLRITVLSSTIKHFRIDPPGPMLIPCNA